MWACLQSNEVQSQLRLLSINYKDLELFEPVSQAIADVIESAYTYEENQKIGQSQAVNKEERFSYLRAWPIEKIGGELLFLLTNYLKPNRILECGTSFGVSTLFFAAALEQLQKGHIITVEVSKLKHEPAAKNFAMAHVLPWITQEKVAFDQYLKYTKDTFDIVFLDCDRSRYHVYIEQLLPHLQPGALIIADNAIDRADDMNAYRNFVTMDKRFATALLSLGDGLLISRFLAN